MLGPGWTTRAGFLNLLLQLYIYLKILPGATLKKYPAWENVLKIQKWICKTKTAKSFCQKSSLDPNFEHRL
jgi:hypothetical protein